MISEGWKPMKVTSTENKFTAKWISLKQATYLDKNNKEQKWDYVTRNTTSKVVTIICHSKRSGKFLLIAQPRVPVNKIVIEFPAGLVDAGENLEEAGLRELKEETGYSGTVLSVYPTMSKSAGLTDESTGVVEIEIDEETAGKSEMEETEDIQSFWISPAEFDKIVRTLDQDKKILDTQVWFYFRGLKNAAPATKKRPSKKQSRKPRK